MPAIFPIVAIVAVIAFISAHAAATPKKEKKKSPSEELAQAFEKVIKEASGAKDDSK